MMKSQKENKLSYNLNLLMKQHQLTDHALSEKIDIPPTTIRKIRTEPNSNPTLNSILPIAKYFNISIHELIGDPPVSSDTHYKNIPIFDWLAYQESRNCAIQKYISVEHALNDKSFAIYLSIQLRGSPFRKGTILIIDPSRAPKNGDYVLSLCKGNLEIHECILSFGDINLKSILPDIIITKKLNNEINIIGVIVETRNTLTAINEL